MDKKRILMLGNSHLVIFGFRGELIQELIQNGHEVIVSFPNGPFGEGEKASREYNCKFIEIPINRRGKNAVQELTLLRRYWLLIKQLKPDVVLAYTVKCDIYGGIVSRLLGIPFLPNVTGLGKGLTDGGIVQAVTVLLYRLAIRNAECIFFQNKQDKRFFLDHNITFRKCEVLPGSGVNLIKFRPLPYPNSNNVVFTYIARVMKAKGIEQFIEAARIIRREYPQTEFHICGYCEDNYRTVLDEEENAGNIVYHGLVHNVIDYEKNSHCIVLPSFHPEGISNVLLEAAACARPIITTNRQGCREAVDNGITGYLVKEQDSADLIDKIKLFLKLSYEEKKLMGYKGREKIEKEFDRKKVVDSYMHIINSIPGCGDTMADVDWGDGGGVV